MKKTGGILTTLGIDSSLPGEYIDPRNCTDCENMEANKGIVRKRCGTVVKGTQSDATEKEIMAGMEFERASALYHIRIGLDKVEKWSAGDWVDITGVALTGTTADPIDTTPSLLAGARIAVFTNGVDAIRKWTGAGDTSGLSATAPIAKYIVHYKEYLMAANIDSYPLRVQWSHNEDITVWDSGNAGYNDLIEEGDKITGLAIYGNYITIHKESCIYMGYPEDATAVFRFDRKATGRGAICNATIKELPTGEQIFLASDGLRIFNGIDAPLIESPITEELREGISPQYVHKSWAILVPELDEYWCALPMTGQTSPDTIYKYNYLTKTIHKDTRSSITAAWLFTKDSSVTIDELVGTIDEQDWRFGDSTLEALSKIVIFGDSSGYTYERSKLVRTDNGVSFIGEWASKDFENEEKGRLAKWLQMEIWAKGDYVELQYSTDRGASWYDVDKYTLSSDYPSDDSPIIAYFNVVSSKIRFKFKNQEDTGVLSLKQFINSYKDREMRG